ncbi:class I SAM-dependent methyltransferase [Leptospira terpstrae]|uniref:class I SAM-dependent methyltransferase n=1 Tax=Leptospira terpstrae TaxID=293075 RepID=UPI003CFE9D01
MDKYLDTSETWNEIANLYAEKFMDFELYNETYDFFCLNLPINANVLEFGCGPGNITKFIKNKRNDLNILGTDISKNMIEIAKKNNPSCNFHVSDIRKFNIHQSKYQGIISGFCLPYLSNSDLENLIPKLYSSLANNGILYLSFVEGNPIESGIKIGRDGKKLYFFYHDKKLVSNILSINHFNIEKSFNLDYQNNDKSVDNHIVFIAKKID